MLLLFDKIFYHCQPLTIKGQTFPTVCQHQSLLGYQQRPRPAYSLELNYMFYVMSL